MLEAALQYASSREGQNLERLCDWLRIPSVSTLPEHTGDMQRAARWAVAFLESLRMDRVELIATPGHPLVYAEHLGGSGPTLLLYGHYDVQPVDPLEAWRHPPFEPLLEGEHVYARGASDDKGQLFAALAALEAYQMSSGQYPINIKVLLEGEEEVMSPNLPAFLLTERDRLRADAVLICDQDMLAPQAPVVMYGVRGNLYLEIEVRGPERDLHSGTFGGAVDNPFNVLVRLLARLQDERTRRVLVPGFYDRVRPLSAAERALIAQAPITDELGLHLTGVPALAGEVGYNLPERISVRPTLEIHGLPGGFTGEGSKTVIPAWARAKLSMRLVPDQQTDEIAVLVEQHLQHLAPPTVNLHVKVIGSAQPVVIDFQAPAVQAAAEAYRQAFGVEPVYLRGGGSLPIVHDLIATLSASAELPIPVVMIGFGLPDGNTHAPNENLHLPSFYRGIDTVIHYLDLFASIPS